MDPTVWTFARDRLVDGESVFLAIVADHTRHSPGTTGAQFAVALDGTTAGTIGGGIMEADVLTMAARVLHGDSSHTYPRQERLTHRRKAPDGASPSGLICAGHQTNLYALLRPERDLPTVQEITARITTDQPGLLTLSPEGLTLDTTDLPPRSTPTTLHPGPPFRFQASLQNWKRAAIIGGGHCGLALSRVLRHLGYTVTVFETRREVFTFQENEHAHHRIVVDDFSEAGPMITLPAWTHVIVMTANLPSDVRGLLGTAELPFPYIGVMGAPAKLQRIRAALRDAGISDDAIAGIHAPIGLPMTSNTPEEIAISIAAQLLQLREELFPFTRPPDPGND